MKKKTYIPDGGFILARRTFSSPIWFKDPLYLKLWVWIIGKANHEKAEKNGFHYKRGEAVTTYHEIITTLSYRHNRKKIAPSLKKVRIMLQWFANEGMIRVEPLQVEAKKSINPQLAERCRTGADSGAETRAYVGIKIIVVNYDAYQNLENYKDRHRGKNPFEQGHNNNNDYNNNDYYNNAAVDLYEVYLKKIEPVYKSRKRAISNIKSHLEKHSHEQLQQSIRNYQTIALMREPLFRKDPANFFGKTEPTFLDYLPKIFNSDNSESDKGVPSVFSVTDHKAMEELYSNG